MNAQRQLKTIAEPYARYLRLLGFEAPPSGVKGLEELVHRHLCRVPFENVSKLLLFGREGARGVGTLSKFLDGIEYEDLGGTCYTSNPFLAEMLQVLGYDADLLGADMGTPNVHTVIRVRVGNVAYHVDVGYAAPFREPMRLDQVPVEVAHGKYRYVLERNGRGEYDMSVWCGPERVHGYAVHGPPRKFAFFRDIILDSYTPGRMFMSCMRITRFFEAHTVELKNSALTYYRGTESKETKLHSMRELRHAVEYDLAMPRCPIEQAVEVLEKVTGRRFFDISAGPQF
jgi:arylamine N-acetyltransferase